MVALREISPWARKAGTLDLASFKLLDYLLAQPAPTSLCSPAYPCKGKRTAKTVAVHRRRGMDFAIAFCRSSGQVIALFGKPRRLGKFQIESSPRVHEGVHYH